MKRTLHVLNQFEVWPLFNPEQLSSKTHPAAQPDDAASRSEPKDCRNAQIV